MWTFGSERRLVASAWTSLAAWFAAAAAFYWIQTRFQPIGGDISWAKLLWLAYAVLFWLVLPALIAADPRVSAAWRRPFLALLILMLARGVAELWMLYVSLNWSPWYGVGHDVLCALTLAAFAWRLWPSRMRWSGLQRTLYAHLALTTFMFAPEIYFAWYMQAHFNTQGAGAIYFVPADPIHAIVLNITAAVVVFLTAYLPFFLFRWLHDPLERSRQTAI